MAAPLPTCLMAALTCLLAAAAADDSSAFQSQLPEEVVWAVSGRDAELPCDLTPDPGDSVNMVLWFKDASGIPLYSVDNRGGDLRRANHSYISRDIGARTFFQTVGARPARLRVKSVGLADEGVFRCRIDFLNSPTRNYRVNLTIVVPPSEPVIYDHKDKEITGVAGPFLEGYNLYLGCKVTGGRPAPQVSWWLGDRLLDSAVESAGDGWTVNQLFLPSVARGFHGRRLECRATSSEHLAPRARSVPLDVYLKPLSVLITTPGDLLSAGRLHSVQCVSSGSYPSARLTWLLDGEPIRSAATTMLEGRNTTTSSLTFQPASGDDGKELACRAENPHFPGGILEDRRRLRVAYPPVAEVRLEERRQLGPLKEGDEVRMTCEVRASPPAGAVAWYHGDRRLSWDEAAGVFPAGSSLRLRPLTKESAGEYSCAARNDEAEVRSNPATVRVQYAPRCRTGFESQRVGAMLDDPVTVRCEVDADPADQDLKFSWTYNRSRDFLHVPVANVRSSGPVSRLDYTPAAEEDFGTLACWASNSVGRQKVPCLVHVVPASLPEPPRDCSLLNDTGEGEVEVEGEGEVFEARLAVRCEPGHDGYLPQHFLLEVTESPQDPPPPPAPRVAGHREQGDQPRGAREFREALPTFSLRHLEPGRRYQLAVHAVNALGRSYPPVLISGVKVAAGTERLLGVDSEEAEDAAMKQPMNIALAALAAVAFVVLGGVVFTAATVICRRRPAPFPPPAPPLPQPPPPSKAPLFHDELLNVMVAVPVAVAAAAEAAGGRPQPRVRFQDELCADDEGGFELASRPPSRVDRPADSGAETRGHGRALNEPDLIASRAEVLVHPARCASPV
ncbi:nephrin [Bacillus rossius redtenbacheri]|uniref:nephrin n=1 Tax=Bacillus rossius redtenbacheri TaxID=93214 RepID=UPI002FDD07EF